MNRNEVSSCSHVDYDDLLLWRLQLQQLIAESSQFEKGNSHCRNVTNFRYIFRLLLKAVTISEII